MAPTTTNTTTPKKSTFRSLLHGGASEAADANRVDEDHHNQDEARRHGNEADACQHGNVAKPAQNSEDAGDHEDPADFRKERHPVEKDVQCARQREHEDCGDSADESVVEVLVGCVMRDRRRRVGTMQLNCNVSHIHFLQLRIAHTP